MRVLSLYNEERRRGCDDEREREAVFVRATWDDEAYVWFVSETDAPGFATKADSLDTLVAKLKVLVPEMLEFNVLT
jgi:hypothetical protein